MTTKDALAVLFVSLGMLSHYRECRHIAEGPGLPLGLLKMALPYVDGIGANTASVRLEFEEFGVDVGPVPEPPIFSNPTGLTAAPDSYSAFRSSRNRVPAPVEEAIRAKYLVGWSKSCIAREFD